jgi:hypothetical protein
MVLRTHEGVEAVGTGARGVVGARLEPMRALLAVSELAPECPPVLTAQSRSASLYPAPPLPSP